MAAALAPRRARSWPWLAAAALVVVAAGAIVLRPTRATTNNRRMVAVMGFANLSGDPDRDWVAPALTEMLATELSAEGKLRLVPGEDVQRARREIAPASASLSADTLGRLRNTLGAELVVTGGYVTAAGDGQIRVDLRIQDTASGETLVALAEHGSQTNLVSLVVNLSGELRAKLGIAAPSAAEAGQIRAILPANTDAAHLYAEAKEKLSKRECLAARVLLERALAADDRFALGHAALGEAWGCLGYETRGGEEAKRAYDLAFELPEKERLWIEAQYWRLSGNREKSLQTYRRLWVLQPDDLEVGLKIVGYQEPDAAWTVAMLRNLPAPASDSPRIDLAETVIAGNLDAALALARRAQEKARAGGNQALLADAYLSEAETLNRMGRAVDAEQVATRARELAASLHEEHLGIVALLEMGVAQFAQAQCTSAAQTVAEAVKLLREMGDTRWLTAALYLLSNTEVWKGELASAHAHVDETVALQSMRKFLRGMASATQLLADIVLKEGDARAARRKLDEADAIAKQGGKQAGNSQAFFDKRYELEWAEDDLAAAQATLEGLLAEADQTGADDGVLRLVEMSRLAYDQSRPAEAERRARLALERLAGMHGAYETYEAWARAFLGQALAAQGRQTEAQVEIARARPVLEKSEWIDARLRGLMAWARVHAATGGPPATADAVAQLEAAVAEATRLGYLNLALELREVIGELDRTPAGRKNLAELEREARERGFLFVARRAAEIPAK